MTEYDEKRAAIKKLLEYLPYGTEFVPFSRSRNKNEKSHSLNWRVTIGRLTTDYSQGCGQCPAYKQATYRLVAEKMAVAAECETGLAHAVATGGENVPRCLNRRIAGPDLADIVYSLVVDASVLDYLDFESWAGDFGYDVDSRAAEKTYQACVKNSLAFRSILRPGNFEQLQTLCQDM